VADIVTVEPLIKRFDADRENSAKELAQSPRRSQLGNEDAISGGWSSQRDLPSEAQGAKEGQDRIFYAARVTLDNTTMNADGGTVNLTPGMAATVEIKTGKRERKRKRKRKRIEPLLSPLMRMTQEAGRER